MNIRPKSQICTKCHKEQACTMAQSSTIKRVLRQSSPAVSKAKQHLHSDPRNLSEPQTLLFIVLGINNFASDLLLTQCWLIILAMFTFQCRNVSFVAAEVSAQLLSVNSLVYVVVYYQLPSLALSFSKGSLCLLFPSLLSHPQFIILSIQKKLRYTK